MDLREQISRLQLTLGALPTKPLARFDELDAKARDLSAKRSEHEERLAALEPPATRFGRVRDPHAEERAFLRTAIEMDERRAGRPRAPTAPGCSASSAIPTRSGPSGMGSRTRSPSCGATTIRFATSSRNGTSSASRAG